MILVCLEFWGQFDVKHVKNWINIGIHLVPGTVRNMTNQTITWTNVYLFEVRSSDICLRSISREKLKISVFDMSMNIPYLRLHNSQGQWVNSLCSSGTIWQHRSGSTLVQVMTCCLTAPNHYPNQCWLIISDVMWYPSEGITMRRSKGTNQYNNVENYI